MVRRLLLASVMICAMSGAVVAQSALEGPLAGPSQPAARPPPRKAVARRKRAIAHKRVVDAPRAPRLPTADVPVRRPPVSEPTTGAPRTTSDPLSFGMKWNGSNDDGRETRTQNYNGDAPGTGAEVGLKLHF